MDYTGQGRGPGWELLFQGFGTGLLNSSLIPLMTTCLGKEGSPLCTPFSQGDTRCWNWLGGGSKLGISMTLKGRGQPWGRCRGMQGDGDSCSGTSSDLMPNDGVGPRAGGCSLHPPAPE